MTKTEIIAELRRSAAEDVGPAITLKNRACLEAIKWKRGEPQSFFSASYDAQRTYCLLVAHALEDECAAT